MKIISNKLINLLAILSIVVITVASYSNGLTGGYLLDDLPNLKNINVFSRFEGLDAWIRYIVSYDSGLLKRPISTLSFLLNTTTLTVNAFSFKLTNIIIHIINGLLLYLVTFKILKIQQYKTKDIQVIALSTMTIWLLHPFFVSTTLYVVQRMAMLPVTFVLLGLYFYLKFRELSDTKSKLANFYLIIAVYLCTLLAVLSKENGIILPFLILLLEYLILKNSLSTPLNKIQKTLIIFPAIFVLMAFLIKFPYFINGYESRDFTMIERLLTESRVLMNYLGHLFLPRFVSPGVYTDGFVISISLTSPITTIISIVSIIIILSFAFIIRKKQPIICFAIFFFFIGHIIESSFIALEIYFEHRNYLPALFLFFPIPLLLTKYLNKYNLNIIIMIIISLYLANTTYKKSLLWADTTKLMLAATEYNPLSIRAIEEKARYHVQDNNTHLAIELLEKSINRFPDTSLRINLLNLKCYTNTATTDDFKELYAYIEINAYNKHDAESIAGFLNILTNDTCLDNNHELAVQLINTLKEQTSFKITKTHKVILSAEIYLGIEMKKFRLINKKINLYLNTYHDFNDVVLMINHLIELNQIHLASDALNVLENELLLEKHKYTDRDYLGAIPIMKNRLK